MVSTKFDPAVHLTKHGWRGKGTALKHGHSTRPLAVVQKKTLSGIGKDRDEAVPFWDHIFASTAATILSATPTSTASSTPNHAPVPTIPNPHRVIAPEVAARFTLSPSARTGREVARRGLYSRFFKGKSIEEKPKEGESRAEAGLAESSISSSEMRVHISADGKEEAERRIRRLRKAERKARRSNEDVGEEAVRLKRTAGATDKSLEDESKRKKRRKDQSGLKDMEEAICVDQLDGDGEVLSGRKKKKKRQKCD